MVQNCSVLAQNCSMCGTIFVPLVEQFADRMRAVTLFVPTMKLNCAVDRTKLFFSDIRLFFLRNYIVLFKEHNSAIMEPFRRKKFLTLF